MFKDKLNWKIKTLHCLNKQCNREKTYKRVSALFEQLYNLKENTFGINCDMFDVEAKIRYISETQTSSKTINTCLCVNLKKKKEKKHPSSRNAAENKIFTLMMMIYTG